MLRAGRGSCAGKSTRTWVLSKSQTKHDKYQTVSQNFHPLYYASFSSSYNSRYCVAEIAIGDGFDLIEASKGTNEPVNQRGQVTQAITDFLKPHQSRLIESKQKGRNTSTIRYKVNKNRTIVLTTDSLSRSCRRSPAVIFPESIHVYSTGGLDCIVKIFFSSHKK